MTRGPKLASRLLLLGLCACGTPVGSSGWVPTSGVRPGPIGEPAVVLWSHGGALIALACYDPLWVERRGPADCADLLPPGATVAFSDGTRATVEERAPYDCGPTAPRAVRLTVSPPPPSGARWATFPASHALDPVTGETTLGNGPVTVGFDHPQATAAAPGFRAECVGGDAPRE